MEITMSRLLCTNRSFELLEPYDWKLSCTVLRGESSRKGADLLDIDKYLNEAHSFGLTSVRAHFNVMAWSEDAEELKHIRNDVGSQLALMECKPRHNTTDAATLYWAAMPGNAGDFPSEESFYTFIEPALCFFTEETNYQSSLSPFGIKMCDRVSGKPLHVDISDLPMKRGITTNRNKFVLGPSGSGKSFFMNHLVRQYWEQGVRREVA
jgi:conjugation system TraG family ATPase